MDKEVFESHYRDLYKDMFRFARYSLRSSEDAEDVVSETVLDAYKERSLLRNPDAFKPWIFRILAIKCKRRIKEYMNAPLSSEDIELEEWTSDTRSENDLDVRAAFFNLSSEERLIISMSVFGGYSSRETGKILNLSDNTVRSKQARALKKMEDTLSQKGVIS